MKVIFQFKDQNGNINTANNVEKDMSNDDIMVLLKSSEIAYPVNTGILFTSKHCVIESSIYDMFTEPYKLLVILKEK